MADTPQPVPHSAATLFYDAFCIGGIGGSLVALYYLAIDFAAGVPFFTPSMLGQLLFHGTPPALVHSVDLPMVLNYTVVHFAAFGVLGLIVAFAVREADLHARHPLVVMAGVFVLLELAIIGAAFVLMPGLIPALGPLHAAVANGLAALGIGLFLLAFHRPEAWQRVKHAAHLPGA